MRETRFLLFERPRRRDRLRPSHLLLEYPRRWHLTNPDTKGIPVDLSSLSVTKLEDVAAVGRRDGRSLGGLLDAVAAVVGVGGRMSGWQVHGIAHYGKNDATVVVVRHEDRGSDEEEEEEEEAGD
ncbi:MAG: hypothetical protein Q9182_006647 [Xanthomendoza sp. 2 TL-2023]